MAANIKLTISSNFDEASADFKQFGQLTEAEAKRAEAALKKIDGEQMDKFTRSTKMATTAIKATRGPTAALEAEYYKLRAQIEKMIKSGIDPMDDRLAKLRVQYTKLDKQLEVTRKASKKLQDQQEQSIKIMNALKLAAVAAGAAAVRAFFEFSKESAQAASDAEETESKFRTVFRDIGAEAEAAANRIGDEFDLAASTVHKLLGDTGDILTGLGFDQDVALELSESASRLAVDLASFTNFAGGAEGASIALTKAMLGEAESAKALGIVIRQDTAEYKDLVARLMETKNIGLVQAKALAALQIATEQSQNSIGDYARTAESAANIQRTLEEQTKRLKEEYGEMVLSGITPARKALRDLFSDIADNISATNVFRDILQDINDGILDEDRSLEDLQMSLEKLEKLNRSASGQGRFKEEIRALKDIIGAYGIQDTFLQREQGKKDALARLEAERYAAEQERLALASSAAKELEDRRQSALSSEEKQLQKLEVQLNYWSQYKDVAGVQALINDLLNERNEVLEEMRAKQEALKEAEGTPEEQVATYNIAPYEEFLATKYQLEQEYAFKTMQTINDVSATEAEAEAKRKAILEQSLNIYAGFFGAMSALTEAFGEDNEAAVAASKALAATQAAINSYLAFTQVLADPSLPFFLKAVSAATILASGLAQQKNIWSAETGGTFKVPNSSSSSRVDNQTMALNPGEEVTVTPRGQSGGSSYTINNYFDKSLLYRLVQEGVDSNDITFTMDNLRAG